jgi:hypothetical protein
MDTQKTKRGVNHEKLMTAMKASKLRMETLMGVSLETVESCLERLRRIREK